LKNDLHADSQKFLAEVKRLQAEINSIIKTHQGELNSLQKSIWAKQKAINETESNLTAIGTYVDKLEERLTSFAITRRDMEEREKKCRSIEESSFKAETETKLMTAKVEDYTKQQEDLKKLLEELALERAKLQQENRKLRTEQEFRISEEEQLKAMVTSLEAETQRLSESLDEYKSEAESLRISLDAIRATNAELREQVDRLEELESELEKSQRANLELKDDYQQIQEKLEGALKKSQNEVHELHSGSPKHLIEETSSQRIDGGRSVVVVQEGATTQPRALVQSGRNIPFRALRKKMSKATGIHGFLTPSSRMEQRLRILKKRPIGLSVSSQFLNEKESEAIDVAMD
jgi:chromosome segregation ATPase